MFVFFAGCFTCCMESGVHVYNVDPLVEKAHFGKFIVIRHLDLNYECFVNSCTHGHAHMEKQYRFVTVQKNITCEIMNTSLLCVEGSCL